MTPAHRPVLWDIYEEHLDEAAFLWGQWERALGAANYGVRDVIDGPEERLLAHLDGLVLGGKRVAEKLLLPALADDDAGKVFASAWSLVQAEDADHLDTLLGELPTAKPPARAALGRALELSARGDLARRLAPVWEKSAAQVRGALFDALATRDPAWAAQRVAACVRETDAALRAAALRALRRAPDRALLGEVEEALRAEDPGVRHEAIATGYVLGVQAVRSACWREAEGTGDGSRLAMALLALRGSGSDREFLVGRMARPEARRHVLWALGFAGDAAAADVLATALDDEKAGRVAGESLTAITGLAIAGPFARPGQTKGPGVEDVAPDDPLPEALPEDLLLVPAPEPVRKWWVGARASFDGGTRYVYGRPRGLEGLRGGLEAGAMWRRPVLGLELQASGLPTDLRGWVRRQVGAG